MLSFGSGGSRPNSLMPESGSELQKAVEAFVEFLASNFLRSIHSARCSSSQSCSPGHEVGRSEVRVAGRSIR